MHFLSHVVSSHFPPLYTLSPHFVCFWGLFGLFRCKDNPAHISHFKPFILNRHTFVYPFLLSFVIRLYLALNSLIINTLNLLPFAVPFLSS